MKRRRILSALLFAVLLVSLCTAGASAAAETGGIRTVEITMTAPQVGKALPTDAKVTSTSDAVITKLQWSGDLAGGKPKQGAACSANITIEIAPGSAAVFAKRTAVQVTVNGQKASLLGYTEKKLDVVAAFYFKPVDTDYTPQQAAAESYDTFDYRAYANVYPDLKAAYGYNAQKLYAHYVNFGKAEGRVGTFISGSNPKSGAPVYGLVAGTNRVKESGEQNTYAVVPATLLDAKPPESVSQLDNWRLNQLTHVWWMSNAKLVAEAYHTDAYMGKSWGGSLSTEPVEVRTKFTIPEELEARTTAARDVYDWEHGIKRSGLGEYEYKQSKASDAYKRASCSDMTILLQAYDYMRGKSTFAAPPADPGTPGNPPAKTVGGFSDVTEKDYFAQPVLWAVEQQITGGTGNGKFSPGNTCTQAQILTFLWRSQGSPEPQGTVEMENFDGTEYYYKAVQWAAEQDMAAGEFNPDQPCTRAMAVTFLWKQAGSPAADPASFTDVSAEAEYAPAVAWAVEKKITGGTTATTFEPDKTCTRGQIVTFLYRAFAT